MSVFGAQMIEICHLSECLQKAQALERWAEGRERAVARLELKVKRLAAQNRADQAARLRFAADYLRQAAFRDRVQAAALRRAAHE
jgi:hypothetical protein